MVSSLRKRLMREAGFENGWTRVAFGDVVRLRRERSSDPEVDHFERYVGLDHIEPGELRIRRWGDLSEGTTFTNVFRAGNVLFGKRRAYQRKVAVADFDGVCSGDIYVLEPKTERLLPELLPFVCQTDGFFEHAVGTSAGSLSPRTNWESLASYEFALPPLNEQRRAISVFSALEDAISALSELTGHLNDLFRAQLLIVGEVVRTPLGDLAELVTKGTTPTTIDRDYVASGVPFLRAEDVLDSDLDFASCETFIDQRTHDALNRSKIRRHDVLLTIAGTVGRVALVPATAVEANCNQAVAILRFADPARARFIAAWLRSQDAQAQLLGSRVTGTISNLSLGKIKSIQVPLVAESDAEAYCQGYRGLASARAEIHERIDSLRSLRKLVLSSMESSASDV
jgi:type I restriction enzyme S subunit